jgi:hypothetical protein
VVEDQSTSPQRTKNLKLSTVLARLEGATGPVGPQGSTWQLSSGTYSLTLGTDGQLTSSDGVLRVSQGINIDHGVISFDPVGNTFFLGDSRTDVSTHFYFYTQGFSADPLSGFTYGQFHDSTNSNSLVLFRTRGSVSNKQAVQTNDVYGRLLFSGYDGTTATFGAQIATVSVGASFNGHTPSAMVFRVSNGTDSPITQFITSTGSFRTNKIGGLGVLPVVVESSMVMSGINTMIPQGTIPAAPTAGMTAVCNGTGWNGGGDGLQHLMIYLNNVWVKVA